jgi:hypothetical protein
MTLFETITTRIWKCDQCGKTGEWDDNWRAKTILHKRGWWDEEITVCSDKCAAEFDQRKKRKKFTK